MPFVVIDSRGNLKGTGTALSCVQGDLFYGSAADTVSRLAKDTNATRYLSNQGTSNNPSWNQVNLANGVTGNLAVANLGSGTGATSSTFWRGDGSWAAPSTLASGNAIIDPIATRVGWLQAQPGTGTLGAAGLTVAASGTVSPVASADTDTSRTACTTSASTGADSGYVTSGIIAPTYGATLIWTVKTDAVITVVRFWVGLIAANGALTGDTITNNAAIMFRFSTQVPDAGWIGYCQPAGVGAPISTTTSLGGVSTNTVYVLKMVIAAGGGSVTFSVNGGASQTLNTNLPAATTALLGKLDVVTAENVAKTLRFAKMFYTTA